MMFIMSVSVLLLLAFPAVISEVVDFTKCREFFFKGKSPVIPGILENSHSQDNQYKTICQKYDNSYRFATLFDTTNKIPVFSAYKFTAAVNVPRPRDEWMNEPQLEHPSDEMGMPYVNQPIDEDYFYNKCNLDRGHLFPSCHSPDNVTARSTFTLTNTVPQKQSFNSGSWNRMEIETKYVMGNYCRDETNQNQMLAHVLTGAVPGNNNLNNRVNIPSFMWMTFCCYNISSESWISQAYWAPNEDENKSDNVTISERSLQELQVFLNTKWVKITQLFDNCAENKNIYMYKSWKHRSRMGDRIRDRMGDRTEDRTEDRTGDRMGDKIRDKIRDRIKLHAHRSLRLRKKASYRDTANNHW